MCADMWQTVCGGGGTPVKGGGACPSHKQALHFYGKG